MSDGAPRGARAAARGRASPSRATPFISFAMRTACAAAAEAPAAAGGSVGAAAAAGALFVCATRRQAQGARARLHRQQAQGVGARRRGGLQRVGEGAGAGLQHVLPQAARVDAERPDERRQRPAAAADERRSARAGGAAAGRAAGGNRLPATERFDRALAQNEARRGRGAARAARRADSART